LHKEKEMEEEQEEGHEQQMELLVVE